MEKDNSWALARSNVAEPIAVHGEIVIAMSGAQDRRLGASGAGRNASTMNEASHRPTPTQIKTSTTSHTVFMDSQRKGAYTPMIAANDQTDKLFKFGWV